MISRFLPKSGFARNVLTLFTGSTIAQAIPVLISPVLTRIYPVGDFATLTVVTTLISLIGVIVAGRYEIGIGLPESEKEGRQLVYLAIIISLFVSLLSFIVFLLFRYPVADLLNNPGAANYILIVPLAAFFYGVYQALTYWNIRQRMYRQIASARVAQSIVNSGLSLGIGYSGWSINGLVAGNVAGNLAALAYTIIGLVPGRTLTFNRDETKKEDLVRLAKKYADLPRVNGVHALTDTLQATLVIVMISAFFGSIATGLYGLTMRILQAPFNMIGSSISIVFYKEVSEKISLKLQITKLVKTTIRTLALLSLPAFIILMIWGPDLFSFVFGKEWRDAGVYARILSPALFLNFISSPVSHLPVILNKQRQFFMFSLIGNCMIILSIFLGSIIFDNIKPALILVSITQVTFYSFLLFYFYTISKNVYK
jgi:O-antigen/teichoic acid export membrane protein